MNRKPILLIRVAAACSAFFAFGHTIGHFTRKSSTDPQAAEVFRQMENYKFPLGGQWRSYDEFYTGMSSNLIITLIVLTIILWMLSGSVEEYFLLVKKLLVPIFLCFAAFAITGFLFFFMVPAITCFVACICIIVAYLQLSKSRAR